MTSGDVLRGKGVIVHLDVNIPLIPCAEMGRLPSDSITLNIDSFKGVSGSK